MYKSIKVTKELYDLLRGEEGSFQVVIKKLLDQKSISPETVEALSCSFGDDTCKDNLDGFIKSLAIANEATKMENLPTWTKAASSDLGMNKEQLLQLGDFEEFYDSDPKSAVMSIMAHIIKSKGDKNERAD